MPMNKEYFQQCKLKKDKAVQTAWIPTRLAVVGKIIRIKDANSNWDDGWEVTDVFLITQDIDKVIIDAQDYKKQRKASDI